MPVSSRDTALAVLVTIVWGMNFVVIEWGLTGVPPLVFVALRFLLVVFPAVFFVRRPAGRWQDIALVGALMSVGQFGFLYSSLAAGMPPGLASLVLQVQAAFTAILGSLVLREHPTIAQRIGVALGLAGLAVIALGRGGSVPLMGLSLCVAAAACWAAGNIAARRLRGVNGLSLTVWSGLVVPVPLLTLAAAIDGPSVVGHALTHLSLVNWASTAYTAVLASLFGYGVWNSLLSRHPAAQVAPFSLLVPLVGITTAFLVRGERPTIWSVVGGVLLLTGVAVTVFGGRLTRFGRTVAPLAH
ncbi:MAG: EamA family transporter [Dermatophilaceae bacterium]